MAEHTHNHETDAQSSNEFASRWNGVLALGQAAVGAMTNNIGFFVESIHNFSDYISFRYKAKSLDPDQKSKSLKFRKIAATTLSVAAIGGIGGAVVHEHNDISEDASVAALCFAGIGAAANTVIWRKVHRVRHNHENDAHKDSRLHTTLDVGTGWIYLGGLVSQKLGYLPDGGNIAVIINSGLVGMGGVQMFRNINRAESSDNTLQYK